MKDALNIMSFEETGYGLLTAPNVKLELELWDRA